MDVQPLFVPSIQCRPRGSVVSTFIVLIFGIVQPDLDAKLRGKVKKVVECIGAERVGQFVWLL